MLKLTPFAILLFCFNVVSAQDSKLGNIPGNIINGGFIAYDSGHVYFTNMYESGKGLYSMKLDGSELKRISYALAEYLNVSNGWLYFDEVNGNMRGIYKMRIDGTEEQRISADNGSYINVIDDWIYYITWAHGSNVCRIRTDGNFPEVLFNADYSWLSTNGSWLYFNSAHPDSGVFRGSFDGRTIEKIISEDIWSPVVDGESIYYREDRDKYRLFKIQEKNGLKKLINSDGDVYDKFIIYKDWIYLSNDLVFKRQNLKTSQSEVIYKGRIMDVGVCPNFVLIRSVHTDKEGNLYDKTVLKPIKN